MPNSSRSIKTAFSLNRQTDINTEVSDAQIAYQRGTQNFLPISRERRQSVSDYGFFGTGSNFASFNALLNEAFVIGARQSPATDLEALFAAAFVMGSVSSAQRDALNAPNEYTHTITWADIGASPQVAYTSLMELIGNNGATPGWKKKAIGAFLSQFSIQGVFGNFIQLSWQGGARQFATETATFPSAPTAANLFYINRCAMILDTAGGTTNVDGKWVGFNLTFNQNPDLKVRSGQPSGEESLIERVDRGDQVVTGSVTIELENTYRDYFLNETEVVLDITASSVGEIDTGESNPATLRIQIPHIVISSESFSEEGRTALLQLDLSEAGVLEKGGDEPATITVVTDIDDSEILVVDP